MSHLGDRVAPLIDGELDLDASERAMTHMASCPHCQEAADLERLTKQRLAGLGTPEPSGDLMQRLLVLGGSDRSSGPALPPAGGYLAGGSGPSYLAGGSGSFGSMAATSTLAPARAMPLTAPSAASTRTPGKGTPAPASRAPRGSTRPARSLTRSTRNRLVLVAASAACLVGVGVAGGVTSAPASTAKRQISPDTFQTQFSTGQRPISPSQASMLRLSNRGR